MSLSKRQKVLLGVFFVGLVALVADRTIPRPQGGPSAASAQSPAPSAAVPSGGATDDENSQTRAPLAERLNRLWPDKADDFVELRDPFSLPVSWADRAARKEKTPDAAETFTRKHQLKAVVIQGEEVCAQINDSVLVPGQVIDGFRLVSVGDRSAIFERDGKPVILELAVP